MIIHIDETQAFIFVVGVIFAIALKVARDEFLNRDNKREHAELRGCVRKLMDHFGLVDGLEEKDLRSHKKKK